MNLTHCLSLRMGYMVLYLQCTNRQLFDLFLNGFFAQFNAALKIFLFGFVFALNFLKHLSNDKNQNMSNPIQYSMFPLLCARCNYFPTIDENKCSNFFSKIQSQINWICACCKKMNHFPIDQSATYYLQNTYFIKNMKLQSFPKLHNLIIVNLQEVNTLLQKPFITLAKNPQRLKANRCLHFLKEMLLSFEQMQKKSILLKMYNNLKGAFLRFSNDNFSWDSFNKRTSLTKIEWILFLIGKYCATIQDDNQNTVFQILLLKNGQQIHRKGSYVVNQFSEDDLSLKEFITDLISQEIPSESIFLKLMTHPQAQEKQNREIKQFKQKLPTKLLFFNKKSDKSEASSFQIIQDLNYAKYHKIQRQNMKIVYPFESNQQDHQNVYDLNLSKSDSSFYFNIFKLSKAEVIDKQKKLSESFCGSIYYQDKSTKQIKLLPIENKTEKKLMGIYIEKLQELRRLGSNQQVIERQENFVEKQIKKSVFRTAKQDSSFKINKIYLETTINHQSCALMYVFRWNQLQQDLYQIFDDSGDEYQFQKLVRYLEETQEFKPDIKSNPFSKKQIPLYVSNQIDLDNQDDFIGL